MSLCIAPPHLAPASQVAAFGTIQCKSIYSVQRPHDSDEVVANLAQHSSSELRPEYLADADRLKKTVAELAVPVH
eukprot:2657181-Pleurochrysis_carterae.AAC.1